ncbi:MAG: ATP-binding protein [Candidatus Altiarchaeota archaeon]
MPNLSDITGSSAFVKILRECVVEPLKGGIEGGSRRIIFYGPPGTGKTFVAKAVAGELGLSFKAVGPNDPAKELINSAKFASRQSLVYFDSVEWVNYRPVLRDSLMNMPAEVLVVGATNFPWRVGSLVSAFPSWVFMPDPDVEARMGIFEHNLGIAADRLDVGRLADMTPGYSASDIHYLCEWVGVSGALSQERLEAAIGSYKTTQIGEWIAEANANIDRLDKATFEPLHRWLLGKEVKA